MHSLTPLSPEKAAYPVSSCFCDHVSCVIFLAVGLDDRTRLQNWLCLKNALVALTRHQFSFLFFIFRRAVSWRAEPRTLQRERRHVAVSDDANHAHRRKHLKLLNLKLHGIFFSFLSPFEKNWVPSISVERQYTTPSNLECRHSGRSASVIPGKKIQPNP